MIGGLISAGLGLASSLLGNRAQEKANKRNAQMARQQEERNYERQKEFAKSGIQWKKEDALKAGIHPLYALGAQTTGFQSYVGGSSYSAPDYSGIASAGQDIGRAIDSTRSPGEKLTAYAKTVQDLTIQRMGLENEVLASQVAKNRAAVTPGIPSETDQYLIEGQNAEGTVTEKPMSRTMAGPGGYREPGSVSDLGYSQNAWGGWSPVASDDVKRRIEDSPEEWVHYYRNNIAPWFDRSLMRPPATPLPPYSRWAYNPIYGYYPERSRSSYEHNRFRNKFGYRERN